MLDTTLRAYIERNKLALLLWAVIFIAMVIFFTVYHPLTPFKGDEWGQIGNMRQGAFPKWHIAMPIKVLPEISTHIATMVGGFIIYPLTGKFFPSLSLAYAMVLSILIATYIFFVGEHAQSPLWVK